MTTFKKLLQFEVHRFRYVLFSLMLMTALVQSGVWLNKLFTAVAEKKEKLLHHTGLGPLDVRFSFLEAIRETRLWLMFPIIVCIAVIGFYIFFIWYRDWFGRSPFVYRLLMLPIPRRNLYLSKLTAILLFTLSLVAFQVVLVFALWGLYRLIVPAEMQLASHLMDVFRAVELWRILLPKQLDMFLFSYGVGILGVIIVFTAIMLERSFREVGIVYGIGYIALCAAAIVWPFAVPGAGGPQSWFYPGELAAIFGVTCVLTAAISLWLSFRLLNRKITV